MLNNGTPYNHIKTGNIYSVITFKCVNKTTDEIEVLYTDGKSLFTRKPEEFFKKFELVGFQMETPKEITSENYVKEAIRTESNDMDAIMERLKNPVVIRLIHSIMGLSTEVGEFMDSIKRHLFYGEALNVKNLKEEGGDIQWYIAVLVDILGMTMDELMTMNITKLKKRFPEKFCTNDALNRDTEQELNHIK